MQLILLNSYNQNKGGRSFNYTPLKEYSIVLKLDYSLQRHGCILDNILVLMVPRILYLTFSLDDIF